MQPLWFLLTACALGMALYRRDLRRDMMYAALLSAPLLILKVGWDGETRALLLHLDRGYLAILGQQLLVLMSFAACASALYKVFLHRITTPAIHPNRRTLLWLPLGESVNGYGGLGGARGNL